MTKLKLFTAVLVISISLQGCSKKTTVTVAQKIQVSTAAAAAQERATSFSLIGPNLVAADSTDTTGVSRWVSAFQRSLNAEATGLGALKDALTKETSLTQTSIDGLKSMALDAQANVTSFNTERQKLKLTDAQNAWADQCAASLQVLADDLTKVSSALTAPVASPAPAPAAP